MSSKKPTSPITVDNITQRYEKNSPGQSEDKEDVRIVTTPDEQAMMHKIEKYMADYDGDDLLHDIMLNFPNASYRAFFLAVRRTHGDIRGRLAVLGEEELKLVIVA